MTHDSLKRPAECSLHLQALWKLDGQGLFGTDKLEFGEGALRLQIQWMTSNLAGGSR